jgi:hypothetical protein
MKTEQPKQEKDYTALLQPVGTKQETLEEVAKNYSKGWGEYDDKKAFIAGAKWQQDKMYSEEDIAKAFDEGVAYETQGKLIKGKEWVKTHKKEWFEQFKNKAPNT